jgi:hypothetical protein
MPKYEVYNTQVISYCLDVEASSAEEAERISADTPLDKWEITYQDLKQDNIIQVSE